MMKTEYQYIRFVELAATGKTRKFSCQNIRSGAELGRVQWYGAWRRYCYFPTVQAVYSASCLADIQHFIGQLEDERKKSNS